MKLRIYDTRKFKWLHAHYDLFRVGIYLATPIIHIGPYVLAKLKPLGR